MLDKRLWAVLASPEASALSRESRVLDIGSDSSVEEDVPVAESVDDCAEGLAGMACLSEETRLFAEAVSPESSALWSF
jgi:hypothetical protein